jgi:hypothetical protein
MVFRDQILSVEIPFGPVRRRMLSGAPNLGQWKLGVAIYDRCNCIVQLVFGDVPLIGKCHLTPVQSANGARGLCRAKIEAVAEDGNQITLRWIIEFAVVPGDGSKMPRPMQPFIGIGENIQNADGNHAVLQIPFERAQTGRIRRTAQPLQNRLSFLNAQILVVQEALVSFCRRILQLSL